MIGRRVISQIAAAVMQAQPELAIQVYLEFCKFTFA